MSNNKKEVRTLRTNNKRKEMKSNQKKRIIKAYVSV